MGHGKGDVALGPNLVEEKLVQVLLAAAAWAVEEVEAGPATTVKAEEVVGCGC